jgi:O-antigen/teichoic acid export membrane protein
MTMGTQVLSALVAFGALPLIIHGLGSERFGLLTLLWSLVGYLSVFDLGSGQALLRYLPRHVAAGNGGEAALVIRMSVLVAAGMGVIGAAVIVALWVLLPGRLVAIPSGMAEEAFTSIAVLSAGLPAILLQASLRSVPMAFNRYGIMNGLYLLSSVLQWAGSAAAVMMGYGLVTVVVITVAARYTVVLLLLWNVLVLVPEALNAPAAGSVRALRGVLSFGGWVSVPQLVAPLFTFLERLILGAAVSLAYVQYFSVPNDVMIRALIVPMSVVAALFPVISGGWDVAGGKARAQQLYRRALGGVLLVVFPLAFTLSVGSEVILSLWVGRSFAVQGSFAMSILAAGLLFNAAAQLPNAALQAIGRPDVPAKILLVQVPVYTALLYALTIWMGVNGTALAWTIRVVVECLVLLFLAKRIMGGSLARSAGSRYAMGIGLISLASAGVVTARFFGAGPAVLVGLLVLFLGAYGSAVWQFLFGEQERLEARATITRMLGRPAAAPAERT